MKKEKAKQSQSLHDVKKRKENVKSYYKRNRIKLQLERHREEKSVEVYQILPKQDLDQLNYRRGLWTHDNVLVDTARYFQAIEKDVQDYFTETIEKYVDHETLALHVVPYNHRLFSMLFTLKLVVSDKFLIPRILDYHYAYFLNDNPSKPNSKHNKIAFLNFLEFNVLDYLHVRTPFEYIDIGDRIVAWLREKRRKIQRSWPFEEQKAKPIVVNADEIFRVNKFERFLEIEETFITNKYIEKISKEVLRWLHGKKELAALIYVMNDKKYFAKNIFDAGTSVWRRKVKQFFGERYQISLSQYLEPSRIKTINYNSLLDKAPYTSI